jgi:hypothetical protein
MPWHEPDMNMTMAETFNLGESEKCRNYANINFSYITFPD